MTDYPESPTSILKTSIRQGKVSVTVDLSHFSFILYALPAERVRGLARFPFQLEESTLNGRKMAWLSVVSSLDRGTRIDSHSAFEQTSYRLHVLHGGQHGHLLLGISIGSLSAVAMRYLWPMPWHLSAMEFQVAYDWAEGKYRDYRLQTQGEWANASWEISDSGESLLRDDIERLALPSSLLASSFNNYFTRRDGSSGLYRVRYHDLALTSGRIKHAQSDILERLGLLSREELSRPALVAIQHQVSCQIFTPTILGESGPLVRRHERDLVGLAFAS